MPEGEPNSDGASTGGVTDTANSGMSKAGYDQWFGVGRSIETSKGR